MQRKRHTSYDTGNNSVEESEKIGTGADATEASCTPEHLITSSLDPEDLPGPRHSQAQDGK